MLVLVNWAPLSVQVLQFWVPVINGSMTVVAVAFGIFMDALELLVAFIQAYVFTMLSAVFIGLSQVKEHAKK